MCHVMWVTLDRQVQRDLGRPSGRVADVCGAVEPLPQSLNPPAERNLDTQGALPLLSFLDWFWGMGSAK